MYRKSKILCFLLLSEGNRSSNRSSLAFTPQSPTNGKSQHLSYTNGEVSPLTTFPLSQPSTQHHDSFEIWSKMRLGLGTGPGSSSSVFWVGGGALYEAYSGKQLAIFEGFDVGKGVRFSENHVRQLSRKIFWFRDPTTGEVMTEYEGKSVQPIVYDCQMIDYHKDVDDGSITYSVEASLRDLHDMPKMKITSQLAGPSQMMLHVPVFIDIPISEDKRYQAWEFYDYSVDPSFPNDKPATAVWCRQGSVAPFNLDSNAVLRFSGHRVDDFEELPGRMKRLVEREYPQFQYPPKDVKEVENFFDKQRKEGR